MALDPTPAPTPDRVRVMIGGAPVTQAFADSIGADAYGENAAAAVEIARRLVAT